MTLPDVEFTVLFDTTTTGRSSFCSQPIFSPKLQKCTAPRAILRFICTFSCSIQYCAISILTGFQSLLCSSFIFCSALTRALGWDADLRSEEHTSELQ